MIKRACLICFAALAAISSLTALGCSGGDQKELPKEVSKEEVLKGAVARAQPMIEMLENLPPEDRQKQASMPRVVTTLKAAAADPATKQRLDAIGVHFN